MNGRFVKRLSVAFASLFVLSMASTAGSGPFARSEPNGRGLSRLKTFLELNLSEEQRTEAIQIIDRFETFRNSAGAKMQQARKDLAAVVNGETWSEDQARAAFQKIASMREDLFVERIKTMAALKELLTPEQLDLLKRQRPRKVQQ